MTYVTDEGEHVVEAGDAFYLPPVHIPKVAAVTEFVQFSPTEQLDRVSRHMTEAAKHAGRERAELMREPWGRRRAAAPPEPQASALALRASNSD